MNTTDGKKTENLGVRFGVAGEDTFARIAQLIANVVFEAAMVGFDEPAMREPFANVGETFDRLPGIPRSIGSLCQIEGAAASFPAIGSNSAHAWLLALGFCPTLSDKELGGAPRHVA